MAKIDLTKIEGYNAMTPEQKLAALEGIELPEPDYTGYVKKETFDKTASEAAKYKKELRDKLTDEEAAKQKANEEYEKMKTDLDALRRASAISENVTEFLSQGYEKTLAQKTAEALVDGDMQTVFANQKIFISEREKAIRADVMRGTPQPAAGSTGKEAPIDFAKAINEAMDSGDMARAAALMRQQQEETQTS